MTVSLDTNILVRALVDDDPAQSAKARLQLRQPCMIAATVIVETEWVLRSLYHWPRREIGQALTAIVDLPDVSIAPDGIRWAIKRYSTGADFADMMHLALSDGAEAFATFDQKLAKQAGQESPLSIEILA